MANMEMENNFPGFAGLDGQAGLDGHPGLIKLYQADNYENFFNWGNLGHVGDTFYFKGPRKEGIKDNLQNIFPNAQIEYHPGDNIAEEWERNEENNPLQYIITITNPNNTIRISLYNDHDPDDGHPDRAVLLVNYVNPLGVIENNFLEQIKNAIISELNQAPQNGGRRRSKKGKSKKQRKSKKSKKSRKNKKTRRH